MVKETHILPRRNTISLGRIFGIPIGLDISWFLIFGLLTWLLAANYFPGEFDDWPVAQYWIVSVVTAILFFASVLLHELGHSLVAMRYKITVNRITLFIFGGVAEIGAEPPSPAAEFWIAVAGPAVSLALAGMFFVLQIMLSAFAPLFALLKYLAFINAILAGFNMIPGFPLDGGRVLRAILWAVTASLRRATLIATTIGRVIAFGFIGFGVLQVFSGNFANGLWIAFIGWFLENAASSEMQVQMVRGLLAGHQVSQAMTREFPAIPEDTRLQTLVDDHILGGGRRSFAVERSGEVVGLLTLHHIREVPRERWAETRVSEAMTSLENCRCVGPQTTLWAALKEMDRDGVNQMPVMDNGHMVGMLSREDVISFMRTVNELGE